MTKDVNDRLLEALRQEPRRCPACGAERLGWDDYIAIPAISNRKCKDCGCTWSPPWRTRHGVFTLVVGIFLVVIGVYGTVQDIYRVATGQFEYILRWYNFVFPRAIWPYVNIGLYIAGTLLGVLMFHKGLRVVRGKGVQPKIIRPGQPVRNVSCQKQDHE